MKLLFSSPSSLEVGLLKGLLDQEGVAYEVRNEDIYPNFPGAAFQPEIWVINETDFERACAARDAWRNSTVGSTLSTEDRKRTKQNCFFSALMGLLFFVFATISGIKLAQTSDAKFVRAMIAGALLSLICFFLAAALWRGQAEKQK